MVISVRKCFCLYRSHSSWVRFFKYITLGEWPIYFGEASLTSSSYGFNLLHWCCLICNMMTTRHHGNSVVIEDHWRPPGEKWLSRQNRWYQSWKIIAKIQTRSNFPLPGKFREGLRERVNWMSNNRWSMFPWKEGSTETASDHCAQVPEWDRGGLRRRNTSSRGPAQRKLISVCIHDSAGLIEF